MRRLLSLLVFPALAFVPRGSGAPAADERIALAVVFDTSGSMRDPLGGSPGRGGDPKFRVAQRAFGAVIDRLETFTKGPSAKPLSVGVYVFRETHAVVALPLAPFDAGKLRQWLASMRPDGSTPLGDALFLAGQHLLATPAASRHILVLTDGANTAGRSPEVALYGIVQSAERKQVAVFTHVIALDIKPSVFAALKKEGATLIGANDEAQLNAQFDFILAEKILVEASR
jgi:hypothetical protein